MSRIEWMWLPAAALAASALLGCDDGTGPGDPDPVNGEIRLVGQGVARERFTAEVAVRGDYAYTSTWSNRGGNAGNAVKIWSVSGDSPTLADSLIVNGADTTGDVQISDDGRLLVVAIEYANGGIAIYDLANPARPQLLARHASENTSSGVHTVKLGRINGVLYAFLSINPGGGRAAQLVIVDLNDPASPREVLVRTMGNPYVHDVFVRDGLLFTALWHDGMTIWDLGGGARGGSPSNPVQIGNVRTAAANNSGGSYVHNLWWFHNPQNGEKRYVFVGEEGPGVIGSTTSGDIHVVDVSDPAQPREVAFYHVPGAGTHNFVMDEESGVLYAAFYNGGVRALDVRGDLEACSAEQKSADGRCNLTLMGREIATALTDIGAVSIWGVAFQGTHLYASDMLSGIFKMDVSGLIRD